MNDFLYYLLDLLLFSLFLGMEILDFHFDSLMLFRYIFRDILFFLIFSLNHGLYFSFFLLKLLSMNSLFFLTLIEFLFNLNKGLFLFLSLLEFLFDFLLLLGFHFHDFSLFLLFHLFNLCFFVLNFHHFLFNFLLDLLFFHFYLLLSLLFYFF